MTALAENPHDRPRAHPLTQGPARQRLGLLLVIVLVATACGSTVPQGQQSAHESDVGMSEFDLGQDTGLTGVGEEEFGPIEGEMSPAEEEAGVPHGEAGPRSNPVGPTADDSSSGRATTPGSGRATTPGARDAARNTAPLEVGITYIDNESSSAALGVESDNTVNGRTAAEAMVRGINRAGGLIGRELEPVWYGWDSSSGNWSVQATAACEKFTRDNPVEVVLDGAFGITGGFGECLQKAGVLHITRGAEGDRISSQQRTLHANTESMIDERNYGAVLSNLASTRYLSSRNQLGIILEECPTLVRAHNDVILPLISKLGLKDPLQRKTECATSLASAGPASSAVSGAILAFRQGGVDRVVFISHHESVLLLLFANAASSQGYRPGYALSSGSQAEFVRTQIPSDQWPQLQGVGFSPTTDVAHRVKPSAVEARCLRLAKAGGVTPQNQLDRGFIYGACALHLLLRAGLEKTKGNSGPGALQNAINGLGESFRAPGLVGNRTRFTSTRHDGPDVVRVFGYDADCSCLRYRGQPLRAPKY